MIPIIVGLLVLILSVNGIFKPRIDRTEEGKTFLYYWWGNKRKYIEIW